MTTLRAAAVAICALALTVALRAGTAAAEENSIHAGATSVQFLVLGGSGSSPAFGTSGIFVKTHFSDRGALRVGADLYLSESTAKPGQTSPQTGNERYYSVSVSAEFEEYVDATGPVTVFLGVGPYWTRSRSSYEFINVDFYNPAYAFYSYYERRSWEVGGAAAVGFEWFFKRRLSMIGRAGASFGVGKHNEYDLHTSNSPGYQTQDNRSEATTATAGSSRAAIGLALYF